MTETVARAEELLTKLELAQKFSSRYQVFPYREAGQIINELSQLADSIPPIQNPQTPDELLQAELRRRIKGETGSFELSASGKRFEYSDVIAMYGIPESDLRALHPWLVEHREEALDSIERLFRKSDITAYELGLPSDIPSIRRQAEEFAAVHIQKYHKRLGKLIQDLTKVGEFLREIDAVPTTEGRSYFHPLTKTLAIGIPAICYTTEDGSLQIRERELITLYGHEGMGHALNYVVTHANGLPYFMTRPSVLTVAVAESIAQFYQRQIFEDLKQSPETQKDLGIQHIFTEIFTEAGDTDLLETYKMKLFQHAVTVLGDKTLGENPKDPETIKRRVERIREVTLFPGYPVAVVEGNLNHYDSQGNLNPALVGELRYCAQPVQRALEEFRRQGMNYNSDQRSLIDETLLRGLWTPEGFVDNARIAAAR